jgi:hypothetical protein
MEFFFLAAFSLFFLKARRFLLLAFLALARFLLALERFLLLAFLAERLLECLSSLSMIRLYFLRRASFFWMTAHSALGTLWNPLDEAF